MSATSDTSHLQSFSAALSGIVATAAQHVVSIRSHRARSSGFVFKPGLVVTADEALAEDGEIVVELQGGERLAARVAGRDPSTDVAVLRIDRSDLQPAALSGDAPATAGSIALAVGAREGAAVAALGIVSVAGPAWRSLRGGEIDARIELDISLRRHAEGALVYDAGGRAIGMAVFGPRRRVLAIPAATILRVAPLLEARGRIARGYLGLGLQPVRIDGEEGVGAMVMSVDAGGPGAAAGVRQGDIVTAFDGEPIRSLRGLVRRLGADSVGRTVALSLRRAEATVAASLTIGERPHA
jgi:S1-C subfamily serine protease